MSYPDYPNNRLIVNGVDLTTKFGLILLDGYTLGPPTPKTYTVDIPGGDGVIDLTDALTGGPVYSNRSQEFTFLVITGNEFEKVKTEVSNFLHGKSFDYQITMDPDYTYHGRFTVSSYSSSMYNIGEVGTISVSVSADPYKSKGEITQVYNSSQGVMAYPVCGSKTVQPKFEFSNDTIVIFDGKRYEMPKGTYTIEDIWFKEGMNEVFLMSQNVTSHILYSELKQYTYADIKNTKNIYTWYLGHTKYYIDTLKIEPTTEIITGEHTLTATDANGNISTVTLNFDGMPLLKIGDVKNTLEVEDGYYWFFNEQIVQDEDTDEYRIVDLQRYNCQTNELYSNEAEIVSLTADFNANITYTTSQLNTDTEISRWMYGQYSSTGSQAMTYDEMSKYKYTNLVQSVYTDAMYEEPDEELVYLNYEWRDL